MKSSHPTDCPKDADAELNTLDSLRKRNIFNGTELKFTGKSYPEADNYFTIRGARFDVSEVDLLAIRQGAKRQRTMGGSSL